MRPRLPMPTSPKPGARPARSQTPRNAAGLVCLVISAFGSGRGMAQVAQPRIPDIRERSGLLMRFTDPPEIFPADKTRDAFYGTRFGDKGLVKHPNTVPDGGLYGLGWKANDTQSVAPFFFGSPGGSTIDPNGGSRPWWRPLRFFQGLAQPFRPVGMYYQMGSYVPIYDLDPIAPGPGPYPYPFYGQWYRGEGWFNHK